MTTGFTPLRSLMFICFTCLTIKLWSQPYVDPFQLRYTYAFRNNSSEATPFKHLWAGSDLPVKLKSNTYLLLSPYYEQWQLDSADEKETYPVVHGFVLPVGLIMPLDKSKWSLTIIPMVRWNGEEHFGKNTFQFGGAAFASYSRMPSQKLRFGVNINDEFFGLFVMPLVGADWRIDKKNYLFGLLPGRLTYEHQLNNHFFWGANFRAISNSFRLSNTQFIRLEDQQLSVFMDYYPVKTICLTIEPGYGIFRKISTGINDRNYLTKVNWGDGPFIKLSASYRVRL